AGSPHRLSSQAARRAYRPDGRLASVAILEPPPNLAHDLRFDRLSPGEQDQHRPAPPCPGQASAQRARASRRRHDQIQLGGAALVQATTRLMRLEQQYPEALQVTAGE